jgi:hemerythrin superfamily protein
MHEHNAKEEQILYPSTDRLLSEGERDELVGSIQAFSALEPPPERPASGGA